MLVCVNDYSHRYPDNTQDGFCVKPECEGIGYLVQENSLLEGTPVCETVCRDPAIVSIIPNTIERRDPVANQEVWKKGELLDWVVGGLVVGCAVMLLLLAINLSSPEVAPNDFSIQPSAPPPSGSSQKKPDRILPSPVTEVQPPYIPQLPSGPSAPPLAMPNDVVTSVPGPPVVSPPAQPQSKMSITDIYRSLPRFLANEGPLWMTNVTAVPRLQLTADSANSDRAVARFMHPKASEALSVPPWYAQFCISKQEWTPLSPANSYDSKAGLVADFCTRNEASRLTIEGVIARYLESINGRSLDNLLSIYAPGAVWVNSASARTKKSSFEANLRQTFRDWPRSRVDLSSEPIITQAENGSTADVSFRTRFRMENPYSRKWTEGIRNTKWLLVHDREWQVKREESALVVPATEGRLPLEVPTLSNRPTPPAAMPPPVSFPLAPPLTASLLGRVRVINVEPTDSLALRSSPGSQALKLADIPFDATGIEIIGNNRTNGSDVWVPVRWNGLPGWVHGGHVDYE